MFDILPYPQITGETPEEQVKELYDYLLRLKEELEFILQNIGSDNLSEEFQKKLSVLGIEVRTASSDAQDAQTIAKNSGITVDDVIGSEKFKASVKATADKSAELVADTIPNVADDRIGQWEKKNKGIAGGVASLGEDGKVPSDQLPEQEEMTIKVNYDNGRLEYGNGGIS